MRAFERQPGESSKAYSAFCTYRDLGPERSLVKASESYYGSTANLAQVKVWSSRFDWVDRARTYDDWQELIGRQAIQEHLESRAEDFAARQAKIREGLLENAELAAEQAKKMLEWPLTEQRVVREDEDGEQVIYQFFPAGWSKGTINSLQNLAAAAVTGSWSSTDPREPTEHEFVRALDALTEDEMQLMIDLNEKMGLRPE